MKKPVRPSHGAWRLALPCASSSPSEGEPGGRPKPRKSSAVSVIIERRQDERQEGQVATIAFGSRCRNMIVRFETPSARAAWMYSKLRPRRNSARTSADQRHPGEQQQDAEQHEEARHQHRRDDQQQIERRDRGPDLDEALEQQIGPAAEIALHRAGRDADDRGDDGQHQPEQHRDAEAVDQPRQHVAALVVGAEPVVFEVAAAVAALLLDHRLALLLRSASRSAGDGAGVGRSRLCVS